MFVPTLIMAVIAIVLFIANFKRGTHIVGLNSSLKMFIEIMPILIFAFIVAGMAQTLLPKQHIASWIGEESGLRGILIGSAAGALTVGGPYVSLPIALSLFRTGASAGAVVAYLSGWSLWGIGRLPMEIGILGWRLAIIRMLSVIIVPPIAGLIAHYLSKIIR